MQNYLDLIFCSNFLLHDNVPDIPHLGNNNYEGQMFNIFLENLCRMQQNNNNFFLDFINANYKQLSQWLKRVDWFELLSRYDYEEDMWKKFVDVIDLGHSLFGPCKCRKQFNRSLYPIYILKDSKLKKGGFRSLGPIR